jgi:hypothetical protein
MIALPVSPHTRQTLASPLSTKPHVNNFSPDSIKISNSKIAFGSSLLSRQKTDCLEGIFSKTENLRKINAFILPRPKIEFKNA